MWLLFAAAADKTRNIRLGPNVTHVILREPAQICQMLATLDELYRRPGRGRRELRQPRAAAAAQHRRQSAQPLPGSSEGWR